MSEGRNAVRILQIVPTLGVGGAERVVVLLTRHLLRTGRVAGVVSLYPATGTALEEELRREGAALFFLGKRRGPDVRMPPRLSRVLAEFRPDVAHSHSTHVLRYLLAALPPWRWGRVVHTLHNVAEREADWPGRLLQRLAFRAGVAAVAIGEAVAESMRRVYGLSPRRTIPNGIALSEFAPDPSARARVRAELSLPPEAPVFLAVGRLQPQKDHATLLRAFAEASATAPEARLLLAGDGELRADLVRLASALGLAGRVHFLGVRGDIPALLAAADALALSSRYEGNPLSVMEAMAAGLPVVATAVGCVPELVTAASGRLVPAGDPAALAGAMRSLAADRALVRDLGAGARRAARLRFDADSMARAYLELYGELA